MTGGVGGVISQIPDNRLLFRLGCLTRNTPASRSSRSRNSHYLQVNCIYCYTTDSVLIESFFPTTRLFSYLFVFPFLLKREKTEVSILPPDYVLQIHSKYGIPLTDRKSGPISEH